MGGRVGRLPPWACPEPDPEIEGFGKSKVFTGEGGQPELNADPRWSLLEGSEGRGRPGENRLVGQRSWLGKKGALQADSGRGRGCSLIEPGASVFSSLK